MEISNLKLLLEVARQRSFSEVAKARNIAPSSVSRAISGLENELGVKLFQRNTRKLEPTEAGLLYIDRISPLVDEIEAAAQVAADMTASPGGHLRITAASVFGQMRIVPLLREFQAAYPDLTVELLLTDSYLDLIEERVDLAVRLGTPRDSSYIARRLRSMRFYVCASPAYLETRGRPDSPHDIAQHTSLLFPRTGHNFNWLFRDKNGDLTEMLISGTCRINNSASIRDCAVAGMGLTLLPDWLIEAEIRSGALVTLFDDYEVTATDFESAIWLLYPSREYVPLKVRVMINHLARHLGKRE